MFRRIYKLQLMSEISRAYLTFSMMLKSTIFRLTVPNRTSKGGLDFSLQSPEFHSCIQFEIRKGLTCWFCWTVKPRVWQRLQPCVLRSNKPVIIWLLETTVLSLKYLINAALVVSLSLASMTRQCKCYAHDKSKAIIRLTSHASR